MNREQLIKRLGRLPTKTDLNLKVLVEEDCGSFIRKKISFSSEDWEIIPAYLCIPKSNKPMPAVYCFHQHAGNHLLGKSEVVWIKGARDQQYAKELAERGYVTISPDAICFEERARTDDPRDYHIQELSTRITKGQTLLGKILFDISAWIDLLEDLVEVDATNIWFIWHSYGGRIAIFAPVFDDRIKASVSNCGSTTYKDMIINDTGIQPDFVVPWILEDGDLEDIVKLIEPANILISGTDDDKWSLSIDHIFHHAIGSFKKWILQTKTFTWKHKFDEKMRSLAYWFLDTHLNKKSPND